VALRPRLATGLPLLRYKVPATTLISARGQGTLGKPSLKSSCFDGGQKEVRPQMAGPLQELEAAT
jgi:hypothetical protein